MSAPAETRQPKGEVDPVRAAAAAFWLGILFKLVAVSPAVVRLIKMPLVWLAFLFSKKVRRNTESNARRILGSTSSPKERRQYGFRVVESFYDFVCDVGQSAGQTLQQLAARIESTDGEPSYRAIRQQHKGAILLTAHMGSFEVGLVALAREEKRIHVVFKRDEVGGFERLRAQLRQKIGVIEAPIEDGLHGWLRLRSALLNDEVVAIQGDRVMPGEKGMCVPVLHGNILLPTGPFKLAAASGSPVVPIFTIRSPRGGVRIYLEQAITVSTDADGVETAVREFSAVLSKYISAFPEQWLVLDRAFCEDNIGP